MDQFKISKWWGEQNVYLMQSWRSVHGFHDGTAVQPKGIAIEGLIARIGGRLQDDDSVACGEENRLLVEHAASQDPLSRSLYYDPVGLLERLVRRNTKNPFVRVH